MLPSVCGELLHRERRYSEQPLQPALNAFAKARHTNLKILEKVTESQLTRTAYLETLGEITLGKLPESWIEHDRGHVQEVKGLRTTIR